MKLFAKKFTKELLHRSPIRRFFFPGHAYNFTAPQLCFLCQCVEETRSVAGGIAEVGCSNGATTVFLNNYLDAQGITKDYVALDTFSGFVAEDVRVEVDARGKKVSHFAEFQSNKQAWFDATLRQNNITRVRSIATDVNNYDLATLGPLSFVLLDVDLYRPIKKSLPELYRVTQPGGIIVVDDCTTADVRWDGADQAYKEFMQSIGQPPVVMHRKLGVIRKT